MNDDRDCSGMDRLLRLAAVLSAVAAMLCMPHGTARAGEPGKTLSGTLKTEAVEECLTGNLQVDLFGMKELRNGPALQDVINTQPMPTRKSIWIAAGLSALIPGAGEIYAESYWKAALFIAIEAAAWTVAYTQDRKGDQQTDSFQAFADRHWSVVKYAKYAETLKPGTTYNWRIPGTEGMDEFDRPWTQVNWAELNRLERDIAGYYSHTLPPYGEQQYFELIGKYPQFNQGWNDSPPTFSYGDPLTPNFLYYSGERGKANDYYTNASRWVTIALLNHLLSAADAAWSASIYNRAQASLGMRVLPAADGYTTMTVFTISYGL
jgi:hypothetical protein